MKMKSMITGVSMAIAAGTELCSEMVSVPVMWIL